MYLVSKVLGQREETVQRLSYINLVKQTFEKHLTWMLVLCFGHRKTSIKI